MYFCAIFFFFIFGKSADPDEMPHHAAFHQGLHCLPNSHLRMSIIVAKDQLCLDKSIFLLLETYNGDEHWNLPGSKTIYGPCCKKTCHQGFANYKGADQPGHSRSLISTFVINLLISRLSISKISTF